MFSEIQRFAHLYSIINLAIMSIESDVLHCIDFADIISDFAAAKSRKVSGLT